MCSLNRVFFLCVFFAGYCPTNLQGQTVRFRKQVLSEQFFSEGAALGDIDRDGQLDVISGPFWYAGPDFKVAIRYTSGERFSIADYSNHFFTFAEDVDQDDWLDLVVVGMPGQPAYWYRNPYANKLDRSDATWPRFEVLDAVGNESPTMIDWEGDGRRALVCLHGGQYGIANPTQLAKAKWDFKALTGSSNLGRFTHGLGVGDVDGDGFLDLLETAGWHRGSRTNDTLLEMHPQKFAESGGSQMFAYDFDGDGDQDVVSVQNAHGFGLKWFERRGSKQDELWVAHDILTDRAEGHPDALRISQMHALALADIDGDGVKDLVTGKRYFAHGGRDPGAHELPVLYWFRTVRQEGRVEFEPHLIDERVGVGTQLTTGDLNADGRVDIVVGNKLGTFVLLNEGPTDEPRRVHRNPAGTNDFAQGVRNAEPLSPEEERKTFLVPADFDVQLVAAEPDIDKPLNMAFDARGRLWVTSTVEYPYPKPIGEPGRDSIKVLEDFDKQGRARKVTTFADGLNIPMGLYPFRDGVICFSIPDILFLRDTDGDGVCDQREKLYGPFDHTRDTHGMCNGFTRGLDGLLYACHGFNNQSEVAGADGQPIRMESGNTFRMTLDGRHLDHFTHGQVNPFGLTIDRRGDFLTADCHTKPVSLLLQDGYYPSFGKPHDGIGFVPDVMEHLHGSTAIGGIAATGHNAAWPRAYQDSTFGGNVMTSRINRNSLIYAGGSVRAKEESDFLISGDSWFRPVDLQIGPDGSLYVADFYNRIIGHYEVPLEHPGRDRHRGRIWRIVPRKADSSPVNLAKATVAQLIEALGAANATLRGLALDQISDRVGVSAVEPLRQALASSSDPMLQAHALWGLWRLKSLEVADLRIAARSDHALVRSHAQRLLASLLDGAPADSEELIRLIQLGLRDTDALAVRNAALAAARVADEALVPSILSAWVPSVRGGRAFKACSENGFAKPSAFAPTL